MTNILNFRIDCLLVVHIYLNFVHIITNRAHIITQILTSSGGITVEQLQNVFKKSNQDEIQTVKQEKCVHVQTSAFTICGFETPRRSGIGVNFELGLFGLFGWN